MRGGVEDRRSKPALQHRLVLPKNLSPASPAPLLVALHGCNQTTTDFAIGTRFDEVAARYGAIVLYPQQRKAANQSVCWNWFLRQHQTRHGGEPAAILELIDDVRRRYAVDGTRIYVVGLSAGGAMAAILGEQAPDVFSGVGIMAGVALHASHDLPSAFAAMAANRMSPAPDLLAAGVPRPLSSGSVRLHPLVAKLTKQSGGILQRSESVSANPKDAIRPFPPSSAARERMRVSIWTGADDKTVAPQNASTLARQYAELLGLDAAERKREPQHGGVSVSRWDDSKGRTRIELRVVTGMGHAWSGGSVDGSFTYPDGPDASSSMLEFFRPFS